MAILNVVLFLSLPTVIKLVLVTVTVGVLYDKEFLYITFGSMLLYVVSNHLMTVYKAKFYKKKSVIDQGTNQKAIDSLINFETVQYFCAEEHERSRFYRTLESMKEADVALAKSDVALQLIRSTLVLAGMTAQSFLAYYKIINGGLTVGDFVVI